MRALGRVRVGVKRYKASVLKAACEGKLLGEQRRWEQEKGNCLRDGDGRELRHWQNDSNGFARLVHSVDFQAKLSTYGCTDVFHTGIETSEMKSDA